MDWSFRLLMVFATALAIIWADDAWLGGGLREGLASGVAIVSGW